LEGVKEQHSLLSLSVFPPSHKHIQSENNFFLPVKLKPKVIKAWLFLPKRYWQHFYFEL